MKEHERQINCVVSREVYREVSLLCAGADISRSDLLGAIMTAQTGHFADWVEAAQQYKQARKQGKVQACQ